MRKRAYQPYVRSSSAGAAVADTRAVAVLAEPPAGRCVLPRVGGRERVLFIGAQFSSLYTLVNTPTRGRVVVCLVFVIVCKYALGHSYVSQ
jgi:hypothetical protein